MPVETPSDLLEAVEEKQGRLYWKTGRLAGKPVGCPNKQGYIVFGYKGRQWKEHRVLFRIYYGYDPDQVDHINRDKTDNRKENLRECDNTNNQWNRSDIKGYRKKRDRYESRITYKGKRINLGSYGCETAARLAYLKASKEMYGEYNGAQPFQTKK